MQIILRLVLESGRMLSEPAQILFETFVVPRVFTKHVGSPCQRTNYSDLDNILTSRPPHTSPATYTSLMEMAQDIASLVK